MIAPGRRSKCFSISSTIFDCGDALGAVGLDHQRLRVRDADRVGDLDLAAVREPGRDDVLGDVARGVGGRAVDLRGVLAGERAAAVAGRAAVGVDDDLAAGEPGVAHRAADLELAGRVDEQVLAQLALGVELAVVGVQHRLDDVLPEVGLDQRLAVDVRACAGSRSGSSRSRPACRSRSARVTWVLPSGRR